jgi:hypothetical protein
VLDPIIGGYQLAKVLMDGESAINIIYTNTMKKMGLPLDGPQAFPNTLPWHHIRKVLGIAAENKKNSILRAHPGSL